MKERENLLKLKEEGKISQNQFKGLLLEIATYLALEQLGIRPIPLHNPFNEEYTKDYHLCVDLIFIHNGLLYGVECKNLSIKWNWNDEEWIQQEVIERFRNLKDVYSVDRKMLVVSYFRDAMFKYIPNDYIIIDTGIQVELDTLNNVIKILQDKLKTSLKLENKPITIVDLPHGYKRNKEKLRYIQRRLKEEYGYD